MFGLGWSASKWSAIFSLVAACIVALASWFQWWDLTYDGAFRVRPWVKAMLVVVTGLLFVALALVIAGP